MLPPLISVRGADMNSCDRSIPTDAERTAYAASYQRSDTGTFRYSFVLILLELHCIQPIWVRNTYKELCSIRCPCGFPLIDCSARTLGDVFLCLMLS